MDQVHLVSNLIIAVGMAFLSVGMIIGLMRAQREFRAITIALTGLFICSGMGRVFYAFHHPFVRNPELTADLLTAGFTLIGVYLVWSLMNKRVELPTYEDVRETNLKLNYYKELFEQFLENSPMLAFLFDGENNLQYVNPAFTEYFGLPREEVLGKPGLPWVTADQVSAVRKHNERVISERRSISEWIYLSRKPGGDTEQFLSVKFPVLGTDGRTWVGGFVVNSSDSMKIEQMKSELVAIIGSTQDAIISKDLDGHIRSWNRGAEELYGYRAEEVIGKSIAILIPAGHEDELPVLLDKVRRGVRIQEFEAVRVCKDGTLKDVSISVSPIRSPDGEVSGAAVVARDITLLKRQQEQISRLNRELQQRVDDLAQTNADLEIARDAAEQASKLKSAFVANISHELRTPLSGILGVNEILLHNHLLTDEQKELGEMVQDSAKALLHVVNDILDLSKIEAGKITLDNAPLDPAAVLRDCSHLMAPSANQKNLKFDVTIDKHLPSTVYGDASRLRQILLNVIGNAIKFTESGSVDVQAKALSTNLQSCVIEFIVNDTGIGIADEHKSLLFLPFAQVDNSATRRFGGTGLGLAITKRFVEMMGGSITVDSKKHVGSTFVVRLPFGRVKSQSAA